MELRRAALKALQEADPAAKAAAARVLHQAADAPLDTLAVLQPEGPLPGRSNRPVLVHPSAVKARSPFTVEGRAALLHAVAHIELNAINNGLNIGNMPIWRRRTATFDGPRKSRRQVIL